jgi:agmatinase
MEAVPYAFFGFDSVWPEDDRADVVVLPISYAGTTSFGGGTGFAPVRLMQASRGFETFHADFNVDLEKYKWLTLDELQSQNNAEIVVREIQAEVADLMGRYAKQRDARHPFLLSVGGEHTITVGVVAGLLQTYPDLVIGQLDAHSDFRDEYHGNRYSHATVGRRLDEMVDGRLRQFGVRSRDRNDPERAVQCLDRTADLFLEHLKRLADTRGHPVYLTFDIDVLDPSLTSTGTPEPDGLSYREAITVVRRCFQELNVVGFDLTEYVPSTLECDVVAAKILFEAAAAHLVTRSA